jgi:mRNA interferase MazF
MRRGEIWIADLEPALGSGANKVRPVVIVTNDNANERAALLRRGVLTVVPLTSSVTKVWDFQVLLPAAETGLDQDSKAQAEQIRSTDVSRLRSRVGALTPSLLSELDEAIALHLGLS